MKEFAWVYITVFTDAIRATDSPIEGFAYEEYEGLDHPECYFEIAFSSRSISRLNKKRRAEIASRVMFHLQDRKIRVSMLRAVG